MKTPPQNRSISVLGCGWLGLPLSKELTKLDYNVKGSTTSHLKLKTLENSGIAPYQINLADNKTFKNIDSFLDSKILFLNIPPRLKSNTPENYFKQVEFLVERIESSGTEMVIFVSSTSVYPNTNAIVTEENKIPPDSSSGRVLIQIEELLLQNQNFKTTILRMAGLVGPDRHPGRFLSGKKNLHNPQGAVNLIHLSDCIDIVIEIIKNNIWGEVFNCCSDIHPTRMEFYTKAANALNLPTPTFIDESTNTFKIVSNEKLKQMLTYSYQFKSPFDMI